MLFNWKQDHSVGFHSSGFHELGKKSVFGKQKNPPWTSFLFGKGPCSRDLLISKKYPNFLWWSLYEYLYLDAVWLTDPNRRLTPKGRTFKKDYCCYFPWFQNNVELCSFSFTQQCQGLLQIHGIKICKTKLTYHRSEANITPELILWAAK